MEGAVAQLFGDLGKVPLSVTDKLFGGIDFHQQEIIDDPAAGIIGEQFLQLGASKKVIPAYFIYCQAVCDMILHIFYNVMEQDIFLCCLPGTGSGDEGDIRADAAKEEYEQELKVKYGSLPGGKRGGGAAGSRFGYDMADEPALGGSYRQDFSM